MSINPVLIFHCLTDTDTCIIVAAGLRTVVSEKKNRSVSFFNDVVTSHHCELYDHIIILHSLEAF